MKRVFGALIVATVAPCALAVSLNVTDVSTVKPAGPRTGDNGKLFLNIEGKGNNANASFGVAEFNPVAQFGFGIADLALHLYDAPASFSTATTFSVFLVTDTTTNIGAANTDLKFDSSVTGGYVSQLGAATKLGVGSYVKTTNGTETVVSLVSDPTLSSYLLYGSKFRLVLTSDTDSGAATFAGRDFNGKTSYGVPKLTYNVVPEPATMIVLGLGLVGVIRRRRA